MKTLPEILSRIVAADQCGTMTIDDLSHLAALDPLRPVALTIGAKRLNIAAVEAEALRLAIRGSFGVSVALTMSDPAMRGDFRNYSARLVKTYTEPETDPVFPLKTFLLAAVAATVLMFVAAAAIVAMR